jgi:hypothetical protein
MFVHTFYNQKTGTYYVCTATDEDDAYHKLEAACDKVDEDTDDWSYIGTSLQLNDIQFCLHQAERQMALGREYEEFYPVASAAG